MNRYISQLSQSQQRKIKILVIEKLVTINGTKKDLDRAMNSRVSDLYDLIPKKELEIILKDR